MTARTVRIALLVLLGIAVLFLFVFPTRSFLAQRRAVNETRHNVEVVQEQIVRLQHEASRLQTPAEIERQARLQFNMVYPGEQPYVVVPDDEDATSEATP